MAVRRFVWIGFGDPRDLGKSPNSLGHREQVIAAPGQRLRRKKGRTASPDWREDKKVYTARKRASRNSGNLEFLFDGSGWVVHRLDPIWRQIGYSRLEKPSAKSEQWTKGAVSDCHKQICIELIQRISEIKGVARVHLMANGQEESVPEIVAGS